MTVILLRNGNVYSPADPFATAMVVEDGTIAWIGAEGAAEAHTSAADEIVDLDGALVTPAFVDSHVHATATGLALTGLDLSRPGGGPDGGAATGRSGSVDAAAGLARIAAYTDTLAPDAVVLGQGWDEPTFPGHLPGGNSGQVPGQVPDVAALDRAVGGRRAYLSRIDVHSALASSALRAAVPGLAGMAGYDPAGPLTGAAHHAVRAAAHASLTAEQRTAAQRAARTRAAALGIGTLVECAGPEIAGEDDLALLLKLAADEPGPQVVAYWGEAVDSAAAARALVSRLGVHGLGGDLFADGAIGSHTACLHHAYTDRPDTTGAAYLDAERIAAHLAACTEAGVQAGFHAIGDAAVDAVVAGTRAAAERHGAGAVRALRHRVEHAELVGDDAVAAMAELGLFASVQPAFDALWGGGEGMYARRLGAERAARMNPFASLNRAGVPLAFGSDAPVTPLDPWGTIRAAAFHRTPAQRMSVRAAFNAHTRGGHRALRRDEEGVLVPGAPATYAVWRAGELTVQAPDRRLSAWSTDPSSGTPGLPDLTPGEELPVCVRTVVRGETVYAAAEG